MEGGRGKMRAQWPLHGGDDWERVWHSRNKWMDGKGRELVCAWLRFGKCCCSLFTQADPDAAELDTVPCGCVGLCVFTDNSGGAMAWGGEKWRSDTAFQADVSQKIKTATHLTEKTLVKMSDQNSNFQSFYSWACLCVDNMSSNIFLSNLILSLFH